MDYFLTFIGILCEVLTIIIIIRSIMSWFSPRPTNMLAIIIYRITEPVLSPLRRIVPMAGMFDLTPLVAVIILQLIIIFLP